MTKSYTYCLKVPFSESVVSNFLSRAHSGWLLFKGVRGASEFTQDVCCWLNSVKSSGPILHVRRIAGNEALRPVSNRLSTASRSRQSLYWKALCETLRTFAFNIGTQSYRDLYHRHFSSSNRPWTRTECTRRFSSVRQRHRSCSIVNDDHGKHLHWCVDCFQYDCSQGSVYPNVFSQIKLKWLISLGVTQMVQLLANQEKLLYSLAILRVM